MSFGFSLSDVAVLAAGVHRVYHEFKQAPGNNAAFAKELYSFHEILFAIGSEPSNKGMGCFFSDSAAFQACLNSCRELLYVQICGARDVFDGIRTFDGLGAPRASSISIRFEKNAIEIDRSNRFLCIWRRKWAGRKFSLQIPKLQRAVAAHVQSLIAFSTLGIRSDQLRLSGCQDRMESLQKQTQDYLQQSQIAIEQSQNELQAISLRVELSQARMERQLHILLVSQGRRGNALLSQSLDASSPEGRDTWMNLGRLLRNEGITPAMIKENSNALVEAMKITLLGDLPSDSPQSYHTALESFPDHHRTFTSPISARPSLQSSMSILGSAPPIGAIFAKENIDGHIGKARSLEQRRNVDDGIQSLLQGMEESKEKNVEGLVDREDGVTIPFHEAKSTGHRLKLRDDASDNSPFDLYEAW